MSKSQPQWQYTCQVSRPRRDCHACGSKTTISRLLTPAFPFLTPGGKVWAITALTDSFWKIFFEYLNKLEPMRENNDRTFAKNLGWSKHRFTGHKSESLRNVFGNRRTSSETVGHFRILSVPYEKSWHSQDKNVTPMNHKKLAGIWQLDPCEFPGGSPPPPYPGA